MDLGISGRRAAVAASSGGLGLASARALAAEGATVAICGRDETRVDAAAASIGDRCIALVCDVAGAPGGAAFIAAANDALGGIDILVTNAGGPPPGNFAETEVDSYAGAIAARNLMSVVAMCKAAVPPIGGFAAPLGRSKPSVEVKTSDGFRLRPPPGLGG